MVVDGFVASAKVVVVEGVVGGVDHVEKGIGTDERDVFWTCTGAGSIFRAVSVTFKNS